MKKVGISAIELRKLFITYITNKHPECGNVQVIANDALYPHRYNIGIDFWDIFISNASVEKCRQLLVKRFQLFGGKTDFDQKAAVYMYAINLLKSFFDEKYGGVQNYILLQTNCTSMQVPLAVNEPHSTYTGKLKSYCEHIRMSYSYKPLLILAMIEYANSNGEVSLSSVAKYFIDYYSERRKNNFIVEKSNSLYFRGEVSLSDAQKNIIDNPARVLAKDGIITLPNSSHLSFSKAALEDLKDSKELIISLCKQALKKYFDGLQKKLKE